MSDKALPLSGYSIGKVYSTHLELRHQTPSKNPEDHEAFRFGWDWRWIDEREFEVRISVAVEPSPARDERILANLIGRFRQVGEVPSVGIDQFVRLQAVAILLPFARQLLSHLTLNSYHGVYYLPSLNVDALMKRFDVGKTTAARQGELSSGAPGTRQVNAVKSRPKASRGRGRKKR